MPVIPFDRRRRDRPSIAVAPTHAPPFPVDAVVVEDDTFHALSGEPVFRPVDEHPIRVISDAHAARPSRPGSVVVRAGRPIRLLAVVHKLDERPTWSERWVALAYRRLFRELDHRKLRSVALPLIGTVHGRLDRERSRTLLLAAIEELRPGSLDRVWLVDGPR